MSKWSRPFKVVRMTSHRAVELYSKYKIKKFMVNGQIVKHYWEDQGDQHKTSIIFEDE